MLSPPPWKRFVSVCLNANQPWKRNKRRVMKTISCWQWRQIHLTSHLAIYFSLTYFLPLNSKELNLRVTAELETLNAWCVTGGGHIKITVSFEFLIQILMNAFHFTQHEACLISSTCNISNVYTSNNIRSFGTTSRMLRFKIHYLPTRDWFLYFLTYYCNRMAILNAFMYIYL